MRQPILIATDFNESSPHLLQEGINLAKALQAPVVMAHAVEAIDDPAESDHDIQLFHQELMQMAEEKMTRERAVWPEDVPVCTLIELGSRVDVLLRLVEENKPSMLLMGTPFREGPPVGIGLQLMLRCPCPVLIVR